MMKLPLAAAIPVAPPTFSRAGQDVLLSARQSSRGAPVSLSDRRRAAVKKAFKRLDPSGYGFTPWEFSRDLLSQAPLAPVAQQRLLAELEPLVEVRDGRKVLAFPAFLSFYQAVSQQISADADFEQLMLSQWGCTDVSDILAAMQRQFAYVGLMSVLPDQSGAGREMSAAGFEAALQRAGLLPRQDDLHRVLSAFRGPAGGINVADFRDRVLAPRPETPPPLPTSAPRDLDLASTAPRGLPMLQDASAASTLVAARSQQLPAALAPPAPMAAAAPSGGGAPADMDAMLASMEADLKHLRKRVAGDAGGAGAAGGPAQAPLAPPPPTAAVAAATASLSAATASDAEMDAALTHMEARMAQLRRHGPPAAAAPAQAAPAPMSAAEAPMSDADMDAALTQLEEHLQHVKAHKPAANAKPHWDKSEDVPDPPDMPHWEHHKYGHHAVTQPAWKPDATVTDMFGKQHSSSDYGYSNYGAGPHGHHVSHYHLNDYHGLAHHAFKEQEYQKQRHGDAAHHGHWVPHLHGMGTSGHRPEHAYGKEEYARQSYGAQGHHGHWVPHLHGIGAGSSSRA